MNDDFQAQWAAQDTRIDTMIRLNHRFLSEHSLKGARTALRRQTILTVGNAISTWIVIPLMGVFVAKHHSDVGLMVSAASVGLYFAAQLIAQIGQVRTLASVDYGQPIAIIQKQIETVARMRIRLTQWIAMSVALLWVPVSIVLAEAIWNIHLVAVAPGWLIANAVFGVLWMAALYLWSKHNAARGHSSRMHRLVRDISGDNLGSATAFLAALSTFEKEELQV